MSDETIQDRLAHPDRQLLADLLDTPAVVDLYFINNRSRARGAALLDAVKTAYRTTPSPENSLFNTRLVALTARVTNMSQAEVLLAITDIEEVTPHVGDMVSIHYVHNVIEPPDREQEPYTELEETTITGRITRINDGVIYFGSRAVPYNDLLKTPGARLRVLMVQRARNF